MHIVKSHSLIFLVGLVSILFIHSNANSQDGYYAGFGVISLIADADLTRAERITVDNTGTVTAQDDYLDDPDLSFDDVVNGVSGYGFQGGYLVTVNSNMLVNVGIQLGQMQNQLRFTEVDVGGATQKKLFLYGFDSDNLYFGFHSSIAGDLGDDPANWSWQAGLQYLTHGNDQLEDSDAGGPDKRKHEIDFTALILDANVGRNIRDSRVFMALSFVDASIELKDIDDRPADTRTRYYYAEWDSTILLSIGADASVESLQIQARLYFVGALGGSMNVGWIF